MKKTSSEHDMNNFSEKDEIKGNFVICGKPVFEENIITSWRYSTVKLSVIKTIHEDINKYCGARGGCVFYVYKDEWYVCSVSMKTLVEAVNNCIRDESHGSELSGGNTGNTGVRKAEGYIL